MRKTIGFIIGIFGIILIVSDGVFLFKVCNALYNNSIGIIGGADGPTSVFIANNIGHVSYIITIGTLLGITFYIYYCFANSDVL